jgi:hypothetical protein
MKEKSASEQKVNCYGSGTGVSDQSVQGIIKLVAKTEFR